MCFTVTTVCIIAERLAIACDFITFVSITKPETQMYAMILTNEWNDTRIQNNATLECKTMTWCSYYSTCAAVNQTISYCSPVRRYILPNQSILAAYAVFVCVVRIINREEKSIHSCPATKAKSNFKHKRKKKYRSSFLFWLHMNFTNVLFCCEILLSTKHQLCLNTNTRTPRTHYRKHYHSLAQSNARCERASFCADYLAVCVGNTRCRTIDARSWREFAGCALKTSVLVPHISQKRLLLQHTIRQYITVAFLDYMLSTIALYQKFEP